MLRSSVGLSLLISPPEFFSEIGDKGTAFF